LPDPDQIMTYCLLREAGLVNPDLPHNFLFASADEQSQADPQILKIEATYGLKNSDLTQGNLVHVKESDGEKCVTMQTFEAVSEKLAALHPDKLVYLKRMADYLQTVELGQFETKGIAQPTLTTLFRGAQLSHYAHEALETTETDLKSGLEGCYAVFQAVLESGQDPFNTIDVSGNECLTLFAELAERQKNHDRDILRELKPEVVQLPTGIQVGSIDVRKANLILPQGAMGQVYRAEDPRSHFKSDVGIVFSDEPDQSLQSRLKVMIGVNTRNKFVRDKMINLQDVAAELNDREFMFGFGDQIQEGQNVYGGHVTNIETEEGPIQMLTFVGSPPETGSALTTTEILGIVEEYFACERLNEAELRQVAELLGKPGLQVELIPGDPIRERGLVGSAITEDGSVPTFHTPRGVSRLQITESDLTLTRNR